MGGGRVGVVRKRAGVSREEGPHPRGSEAALLRNRASRRPLGEDPTLCERGVVGLTYDDEVVVERDVEDLAGFVELPRHLEVLPARLRVARGMVVAANDGRCVVEKGRLVDVPGTDNRLAQTALRHPDDRLDDIGGVQETGDKDFAGGLLVDLLPEKAAHLIGSGDLIALARTVEAFLLAQGDAGFADRVVFRQSHG